MFIAASIGASAFSASEQEPMKAYLTLTVAHFSSLLFICILIVIPTQTWASLSVGLAGLGVGGVAYSIRQRIGVFFTLHSRIDLADRMFYIFIPSLGYLLLVVSAVTLSEQRPLSAEFINSRRRGSRSALGFDQKCLGYDHMDHHAVTCVVAPQLNDA